MKLFLVGFLSLLGVVSGLIPEAQAERILYVVPQRVVLEPNERSTTMTIMNQSDKKRGYDISLINSVMQDDGKTKRVDTFPYAADRMLRYVPRSVELEPGQRQTVRIMARRPRDLEDGDYHSHIRFRERPLETPEGKDGEQLSFEVGAQFGVAVPVIVQQGNIQSTLRLEGVDKQASTQNNKLMVNFSRTGNAEASAYLRVYRKTPDGLEMLASPFWSLAYREVDTVTRAVPLLKGQKLEGNIVLRLHENAQEKASVLQELEVAF